MWFVILLIIFKSIKHINEQFFFQDNVPAGIIYAEDIEEVVEDHEEAQKDISKVLIPTAMFIINSLCC